MTFMIMMMANYEIVNFIAIMQLNVWLTKLQFSAESVCIKLYRCMLLASKEIKRNFGLRFCFLFLNWTVLSSKTFTLFFKCQEPPAEDYFHHGNLECLLLILHHTIFKGKHLKMIQIWYYRNIIISFHHLKWSLYCFKWTRNLYVYVFIT